MAEPSEPYLRPYARALRQHGEAFESLLWASPRTQAARFEALARIYDFAGRRVLDAGCGRADLLEYLISRGMIPADYIGLEAMAEHARAAIGKRLPLCQIVQADFVAEPWRLLAGAEAIVFCGSLNTMDAPTFYRTLDGAAQAASDAIVLNFLSSPALAGAKWLTWHPPARVEEHLGRLGLKTARLDDYMEGDCTIAARR